LHNNNIKEAMQFATAAAALTIQSLGAQHSIPTEDEVIAFIKKEINYQKSSNN
jgi:sugar/nucleoside kinase (ribokinase family)